MLIKQSNLKIWRAKTKEIKLYLNQEIVDRCSENSYEKSPIFKAIKVDDNEDIWDKPLFVDDKFYHVCCRQGNNHTIRELEYYKFNEDLSYLDEDNEDNIKCPVCGYEESDCYEYDNDECDNHQCQGCGSTLSWSREYTVTYNTVAKKVNQFKKIS